MNQSYRLVWSASRQAYVVAHENAKARGKTGKVGALLVALAAALLGNAPTAWAAGCNVSSGQTLAHCSVDSSGTSVNVAAGGQISALPNQQAVTIQTTLGTGSLTNIAINNNGQIISDNASAVSLITDAGQSLHLDNLDNAANASILVNGALGSAIEINGNGAAISIGSLNNAGTLQSNAMNSAAINTRGDVTIRGNLDNSGTISGTSDSGGAIALDGTQINGKIINRQDASISGDTSSGVGLLLNTGTHVTGGLSNAGYISNIEVSNSTLGGLTNTSTGSIGHLDSNQEALRLKNDARIEGDLNNHGKIQSGERAIVIDTATISGHFINRGSITGSRGLTASGLTMGGNLTNAQGALIDGAEGAIGIDNSTLNSLYNQGTLSSSEGDGIYLEIVALNGDLSNSGKISAEYYAISTWNTTITGDLLNSGTITSTGDGFNINESTIQGSLINSASINSTDGDGIDLDTVTLNGDLKNSGRIDADDDGLDLDELDLGGQLLNQGHIVAGGSGITIRDSHLADQLLNTGTIQSVEEGLSISHTEVEGNIRNEGSIVSSTGPAILLDTVRVQHVSNTGLLKGDIGLVATAGSLGTLDNSGTIQGQKQAVWLDNSQTSAINVSGTQARFIGDVKAVGTAFNLTTGTTFANEGAIDVASFSIDQGATLLMGTGASNTKGSVEASAIAKDGITVGNGGFNNSGTLALGATTVGTVHGDYTQQASGVLKVGVANTTTFGKLVVDGNATLANNAKIVVDVATPYYTFNVASLQNILSATHLNSNGSFAVSDNSVLFDFGARKDGNTVDLTVTASAATHAGSGVESIVRGMGNTPAHGAAQVLDQAFAGNSTSDLAGHFVGLSSHQQVSEAVTQSLPLLSGNSSGATSNTLAGINRVIQARQDSNRGLSSGDAATAQNNLWIKTFGSWADQNERSGVSGYDADTKGLAIGADTAVWEQARLGVAFAYAKTHVDSDSKIAPQNAEIDTFQVIGYGSYELAPGTELNVQVDAGQNKNKGKRHMPFADATAKSDYDGYSAHAGVGLAHTLRFSEQLSFVPSVRADYTWIGDEAYHEKGAGALDLDVDSRNAEALILGVDGKLNYSVGPNTVLSANLGAGYDTINESTSITSAYAGAPGGVFSTRGLEPEPWIGRAGLGLSHTLNNGTEISVRYDAESRSDFVNQGASVKARWNF